MASTISPARRKGLTVGRILTRLGAVAGLAAFLAPWLFVRGCNSAAEYTGLEMAQDEALGGFLFTVLIAVPGIVGLAILIFVTTKRHVLRRRLGRLKMVLAATAALPALDTILTVLNIPASQNWIQVELRWGAWASLSGFSLACVGGLVEVLTTGPPDVLPSGKPDRAKVAKTLHVLASLWAGLIALLVFIGNINEADNPQSPLNRYMNYDSETWLMLGATVAAVLVGVVFLSFFIKREKGQRPATSKPLASASSIVCPVCAKKTLAGEFCGWCGAPISVPEQIGSSPGQASAQLAGSRSSPARLSIACSSCGRELPAGSTFCGWCGAPVTAPESPAAAEPVILEPELAPMMAANKPIPKPAQENEPLQQAIAAVRAGHKAEARQMLEQILQANPGHEQTWLWMGAVVETDAERVKCLENVLAINPSNAAARKGLTQLQAHAETPPAMSQSPPPPAATRCPHCGATNRAGAKFCGECGRRMGEEGETLPSEY